MTTVDQNGQAVTVAPAGELAPASPAGHPAAPAAPSLPERTPSAPDLVGDRPSAPATPAPIVGGDLSTVESVKQTTEILAPWAEKLWGPVAAQVVREFMPAYYGPGKLPPNEPRSHPFDLRAFEGSFSDADWPFVHAFANRCAAAGLEVQHVAGMLDFLLKSAKEGERILREHSRKQGPTLRAQEEANERANQNTVITLRRDWGPSYDVNIDAIRRHVESLPAAERKALMEERGPDGALTINSPEKMKALAAVAVAKHLPSGAELDTEIAEHERFMRQHRREWNRDQVRQDRYYALLRRRLGEG